MQKGDLVQSHLLGNTIYMTYCGLTDFHLVLLDTLHRKLN